MNTGIGDATNLAWKLAAVINKRASPELLDTYETERIGFAHRLVNTTDKGFTALTDEGWKGWFAREFMIPYIMPAFLKLTGTSPWETTSQINIEYKDSSLSENARGVNGALVAGNRLAWVRTDVDGKEGEGEVGDNYEALRQTKWAVHVYGEVERDTRRALQAEGIEVVKFPWSEDARNKGLVEGALYLVRPDGYVGMKASGHDAAAVVSYVEKWGLRGSL